MNFRYPTEVDRSLEDLLARSPACDLHAIRRAVPALRGQSMDHVALRVDEVLRRRSFAPTK